MILPREFPNTQPSATNERPKVRSEGVQVIRNACLTLNSTSPELVRSIVVLVGLDDLPIGPSTAPVLAQRIADEYGLAADGHVSRYRLVVRVRRLDPIVTADGRGTSTLGETVKALARVFHLAESLSRHDPDQATGPRERTR